MDDDNDDGVVTSLCTHETEYIVRQPHTKVFLLISASHRLKITSLTCPLRTMITIFVQCVSNANANHHRALNAVEGGGSLSSFGLWMHFELRYLITKNSNGPMF